MNALRFSAVGCSRPRICSLLIRPGGKQLIVMPSGASSRDKPFAQLCSAAFATDAMFTPGGSFAPVMLMIRPHL